jgi:hypothetical protein|uniref:LamG-like jellyroll fold domain-containing protein n=1 Tax=Prosthecobacter sp. TaxID=1965333 RepID=UPI00378505C1
MRPRDLEVLDAWRHGRLSEDEFAALQDRLRDDASLRAALRELAEVEEGLSALAMARATAPASRPKPKAVTFRSNWLPWGIAAAACVVAVASWWSPHDARQDKAISQGASTTAREVTAMLVDEAGAVFAWPRQPGEVRFDPGSYELESGTVHLRYVNGADLVVEGPARFEIRDAFRTDLAAGRVRAIVPPTAHGFTVVTRDVAYEDVGTEFGLSVDAASGASQMHVFDGQVNLRSGDASGELLRSVFVGDSVGFREGQVEEVSEMDVGEFPSPGDIGHLRWASQRKERLADPGLIAWFPFERGGNASLLVNVARDHGVPDGRIAGARWATGRWPGKQALWFDRDSDFVEIEIPGEHSELTVAVWLKVDRFEHEMNAILNSNGADAGDVHFQMNRLGLPRGGLLGLERPHQRWVGNPVPMGKWVQVVSVLSLPQRRHVIYVNGLPVLKSELEKGDLLLKPGHCRLGNWLGDAHFRDGSSRALCGLVDELTIWNRALSAEEVAALLESGRPSLLWSHDNPPLKVPMPKL